MSEVVQRPWGTYTILDEGPTYKVKRIEVLPGSRLSYQKHFRRSEHWITVAGNARVVLNDHEILLEPGGTFATVPRIESLSGRSTTWCNFRKPRLRTIVLCVFGAAMKLR